VIFGAWPTLSEKTECEQTAGAGRSLFSAFVAGALTGWKFFGEEFLQGSTDARGCTGLQVILLEALFVVRSEIIVFVDFSEPAPGVIYPVPYFYPTIYYCKIFIQVAHQFLLGGLEETRSPTSILARSGPQWPLKGGLVTVAWGWDVGKQQSGRSIRFF
jgi:hypothetical protein